MRRRRLPARRSRRTEALVPYEATTDFRYLESVVTMQFPIRSAKAYLQRNMGNVVRYQLVEARRGERIGSVRAAEIRHANGGHRTLIYGERMLANGMPASFFVPDHLVQIRAVVEGAAARSRNLSVDDEITLFVPVRGYLRFLPEIYQGEGAVSAQSTALTRSTEVQRYLGTTQDVGHQQIVLDEDPMRRFLFIFQHVMTTVTDRIDHIADLTDPLLCDARFLPWLASWVGFQLDEGLPVHQQRELVRRAIRLMRTRGTRLGIEEMVRVLTSAPVRMRERVKPPAAALGKTAVLISGKTVAERYERKQPLGCYLMEPTEKRGTSFFQLMLEPRERFQNRFGERASQVLRRITRVVSQERPTHVGFTVIFDERR